MRISSEWHRHRTIYLLFIAQLGKMTSPPRVIRTIVKPFQATTRDSPRLPKSLLDQPRDVKQMTLSTLLRATPHRWKVRSKPSRWRWRPSSPSLSSSVMSLNFAPTSIRRTHLQADPKSYPHQPVVNRRKMNFLPDTITKLSRQK